MSAAASAAPFTPVAAEPAVRCENLTKRYAGRAVVDGLDLTVNRGEIFALLGPNGAGKTTTVEMIEGYRRPDAGAIRVLGLDPRRDAGHLKPRIGLMLQTGGLYSQLRPIEALRLFADFYPDPLEPQAVLEQVGLRDVARSRYRDLSGGERQRLSLALALIGKPELTILDEPTAAMDAQARRATWGFLRDLKAAGTTILLTTHFLDEAEQLADRVAIIDHGRLVALGSPAELRRGAEAAPGDVREVRLELSAPLDAAHEEGLRRLAHVDAVRAERPGVYAVSTTSPGELLVELSTWLWASRIEPLALRVGQASLEDVFLELVGEAAAGAPGAAAEASHAGSADGGSVGASATDGPRGTPGAAK